MQIYLLACGKQMPSWVSEGCDTFVKRLAPHHKTHLIEVASTKRLKHTLPQQAMAQEAQRIIQALPKSAHVIALDAAGKRYASETFAAHYAQWRELGRDMCFVVGGPDGLAPEILQLAAEKLSLSTLTLPHPLVRIVLLEQLYRAVTIYQGHPYHR